MAFTVPDHLQITIKGATNNTDDNAGMTFENAEGNRQWTLQPRSKNGNSAGFDTLVFTAGNTTGLAKQVTLSSSQSGSTIIAKEVSMWPCSLCLPLRMHR